MKSSWAAVVLAVGFALGTLAEPAVDTSLQLAGAEAAVAVLADPIELRAGRVPLRLPPSALARVDHLWAWSSTCPVTRVEGRNVERFRCTKADSWLEVRLRWPGSPRTEMPAGRLLAAPLETWTEVFEPLLPAWTADETGVVRIPVGGEAPLRIRFVGPEMGSAWREVSPRAGGVALELEPTVDRPVQVLDPAGAALSPSFLSLWSPGRVEDRFRAMMGSDGRAVLEVEALPAGTELTVVVNAPGFLPVRLELTAERLPETIRLERGCFLSGIARDPQGGALEGVTVEAEGYAGSGTGLLLKGEATTDAAGRFDLGPLARAPVVIALRAEGRADRLLRRFLGDCDGELDLGAIVLPSAGLLTIDVVDDLGMPVAGAEVKASSGERAVSSEDGEAVLTRVSPLEALGIRVTAERHLPVETTLTSPLPADSTIELERAALVRGRLVDGSGESLAGTVQVRVGSHFHDDDFGLDGFLVEVRAGREHELRIRSGSTLEVARRIPPLDAGMEVDLGDIAAPTGWIVTGRLIREDTAEAVAGARLWALSPSADEVVAWALGEQVSTTSDAEGAFRLSGLHPGAVSLRIEGTDVAPKSMGVLPPRDDEPPEVDLGTVTLRPGTEVRVHGELPDGSIARVDWGREWREMEMLRASVVAGESLVRNVPSGPAIVTVVDGRRQLCEEQVEVPPSGRVDVECVAGRLRVAGSVSVGGRARGSGTLIWLSDAGGNTLILNRRSRLGSGEARIFGAGRPQVDVEVARDGSFVTDALGGGSWNVLWRPESGGEGRARQIELPEEGQVELVLDFAPHAVSGSVVDEEGDAVAGARVVDVLTGAATRTAEDGSFTLVDVTPGAVRLMASKEDLRSRLLDLEVEADRSPEPVILVLERAVDERLRIVLSIDGLPAVGGFAFVELEGGGLRILTTDDHGVASLTLQPPWPGRLRVAGMAGGRLALGDWVSRKDALAQGLAIAIGRGGGLEVHSGEATELAVISENGWNLAVLFRHLGLRLAVGGQEPLVLTGLPQGRYRVTANAIESTADVQPGELVRLELAR